MPAEEAPASVLSSSEQAPRLSTAAVNRTAEVIRVRITARTVIDTMTKINCDLSHRLHIADRLDTQPILPVL
ncbi:hypothetical protein Asi03nite_41430 [Actinoplanes siamensis]|uniref:Uncharacterized protein n=1 Tax=Actinoplanes siamensis TaxID=1223317 RepID=A0A919N9A1_9ACTN|nr:hypothetical protein Asi03nite_41430 [Actinoplanes siamensis]